MPVVLVHQLPFFSPICSGAAMALSRGILLQCSSSMQPAEIFADDPSVPGLHDGGAPQPKFGATFLDWLVVNSDK